MQKQVDKTHYEFAKYVTKRRWASMWHQLNEVLALEPETVLEIGPGAGVFRALANLFGPKVETLDIDPELNADHLSSVLKMPFEENEFDVVCAFQMLEHLPFGQSVDAFGEMARVGRKAVVISLPDAAIRWPMSIYIPKIGAINFSIPKPRLRVPQHQFDGEHYWELNKAGYAAEEVVAKLSGQARLEVSSDFRVHENQYHRFFVFKKLT